MKKLFADTRLLDKGCIERYGLTEDIMMENAASALEDAVLAKFNGINSNNGGVLIITGGGNNGGDGFALARKLCGSVKVSVYCAVPPKSGECILQYERAKKAGVQFIEKDALSEALVQSTVIVDCLYGSGFHGALDSEASALIQKVNSVASYKIACDIPSGIDSHGVIASKDSNQNPLAFKADETVTMGALKTALYSDSAKDFCGSIFCAPLGISAQLFESTSEKLPSEAFLIEKNDLHLPLRNKMCVNKGSFGHTAVVIGEKSGAAIIAASAASAFGSGLVTLVSANAAEMPATFEKCPAADGDEVLPVFCPPDIMQAKTFPANTTAAALGMGLGSSSASDFFIDLFSGWFSEHKNVRCVFDADMFRSKKIDALLNRFALSVSEKRLILTPHPKEFQSLLKICGFGEISVQQIIAERIPLSKKFVEKFPGAVLLVKGSNVCITLKDEKSGEIQTYINPFGKACLAKGGSGDVLAGLAASLLAQEYSAFDAAVSASLAHTLASCTIETDYGMTPLMLIEKVRNLNGTFNFPGSGK